MGSDPICDLVFSAQLGLAQLAVDEAKYLDVDVVGFSGGVAYNEHIAQVMRKVVEENGLRDF